MHAVVPVLVCRDFYMVAIAQITQPSIVLLFDGLRSHAHGGKADYYDRDRRIPSRYFFFCIKIKTSSDEKVVARFRDYSWVHILKI
jgi:hypothetical protein